MWFIYMTFVILSFALMLFRNYIVRHSRSAKKTKKIIRVMAVLGSGGHTTEMMELLKNFDENIYQPRFYIVADTDKMSINKLESLEKPRKKMQYEIETVPRSREVGQSYFTSIWSTLYATYFSFYAVWKHKLAIFFKNYLYRPELLLVNGPGTCIPIVLIAAFFDMLRLRDTCIIYEESICRVQHLSLSGLILYHLRLTDELIVQWPQLVQKYPRCKLIDKL